MMVGEEVPLSREGSIRYLTNTNKHIETVHWHDFVRVQEGKGASFSMNWGVVDLQSPMS